MTEIQRTLGSEIQHQPQSENLVAALKAWQQAQVQPQPTQAQPTSDPSYSSFNYQTSDQAISNIFHVLDQLSSKGIIKYDPNPHPSTILQSDPFRHESFTLEKDLSIGKGRDGKTYYIPKGTRGSSETKATIFELPSKKFIYISNAIVQGQPALKFGVSSDFTKTKNSPNFDSISHPTKQGIYKDPKLKTDAETFKTLELNSKNELVLKAGAESISSADTIASHPSAKSWRDALPSK